ncbi:MAG: tryptophan 2,3-dioxygenase family protein [Candidatus Eremiobacteraeota bacterium]|nr:tryptophan 2,3-dioxygenase family protein [Candidatus Eremiobacteraeota bacterium]
MSQPQAANLSYGSYLHVDELLELQQPLNEPRHHDEMLFIIIHQVYELWFKQLLHELDETLRALDDNDLLRVSRRFKRIDTIQRLIEQQVDVLETMTPLEFSEFRDNLNPASGFQSIQFREIEFLSGLKHTEHLKHIQMNAMVQARLDRRMNEPTLVDGVKSLLARRSFSVGSHDELLETYRMIYTHPDRNYDLYMLLEELIEYDERLLLWRGRHVRMVERMIGFKRGTGGSLGVGYLNTTLEKKVFPELWEVRTHLGKGTYGQCPR